MSNLFSKIFGQILNMNDSSDDQTSRIEQPQEPILAGKLGNHFMKGKDARTSYVQMLQLVQMMMKPYAAQKDEGSRFVENVYQAIGETTPFEELLSKVLQYEESDVTNWAKEVREADGNASFALDALLLWHEMEAGDEGLQTLTGFFSVLSLEQELVSEAGQAAKLIQAEDVKGFLDIDWHMIMPEMMKGYFASWDAKEQELFEKAENLFIRDHITEAYPYFETLAKLGNKHAFYFLGGYHSQDFSDEWKKDTELGFSYYRKGAEKGDLLCAVMLAFEPDADKEAILTETVPPLLSSEQIKDTVVQTKLGDILEENLSLFIGGDSLPKMGFENARQVRQFIKSGRVKAAAEGYWSAIFRLAQKDENGEWKAGNVEDAVNGLEKLYKAKGDHIKKAFSRIVALYEENGSETKAEKWYAKGVDDGYDWALMLWAKKYSGKKDWDKSLALYKKAYEMYGKFAGAAADEIGNIYRDPKEDPQAALKWYRKSAEEGCDRGIFHIGYMYTCGEGVEKDVHKAIEWYRKAYEMHGDAAKFAANNIGVLYQNEDDTKAVEWYQRGADLGSDWAMKRMGDMYQSGKGVEKDISKAIEWYRKAYEMHGDAAENAANDLGFLYKHVIENYEKAMEWYRKCYEMHGDLEGLTAVSIGILYECEIKDYEKAVEWYQRGAELGSDYAMKNLGMMYQYGRGVNIDLDMAEKWYRKAYEMHGSAAGDAEKRLREMGRF